MKNRKSGYTLLEAITATVLMSLVLAAAVSGFAYILRSDRLITTQNELDLDARLLVERLRHDLWLTSRGEILMYPPGDGPYTAISFPVIYGGSGVEVDENGELLWDATVIYHMWQGENFQVRRTVLEPWTDLTKDQRQQQLADVAENGDGTGATGGESSTTRTLINNLVDWELDITPSRFDTYAETDASQEISFGSSLLDSGPQTITFRSAGLNSASQGRYLGVDVLRPNPSALPLEAEWMPVISSEGLAPAPQNMTANETWSGNARLWYPATADGQSFTLSFTNDVWDERNFLSTGDKKERLERFPMTKSGINTFGLKLEGRGVVWRASEQTGDASTTNKFITCPNDVRVFVRGDDFTNNFDGGWLGFNGTNVWATFSVSNTPVNMTSVYIAQNDRYAEGQIVAGTSKNFTFGGGASRTFSGTTNSDPLSYSIERSNSYLIGFTIDSASKDVRYWSPTTGITRANSYVWNGASWQPTNIVIALNYLRTGHAPEGKYTSAIIDTQMDNPSFQRINWAEYLPSGYSLVTPSIGMKIRAGNDTTLSNVTWTTAINGAAPAINGRYIQVEATLRAGVNASTRDTASPELHDFQVSWTGPNRFVGLSGKFAVGPNNGIYEVEINGIPLLRGITVNVSVYKDVQMGLGPARRITGTAFAEIVPRN